MSFLSAFLIGMAFITISCTQASTFAPIKPSVIAEPRSIRQTDEFIENKIPLQLPLIQPRIIVAKGKRRLTLYSGGKLVRTFRIGLGLSPIEDKIKEGDRRTPEGEFYIFTKNDKSNYYLSLGISYPNAEDAERGLRDDLISREQYDQILSALHKKVAPPQNTPLGGQIYIHGNGSQTDWTWGCVALDDKDIRDLFNVVPIGTQVIIEH